MIIDGIQDFIGILYVDGYYDYCCGGCEEILRVTNILTNEKYMDLNRDNGLRGDPAEYWETVGSKETILLPKGKLVYMEGTAGDLTPYAKHFTHFFNGHSIHPASEIGKEWSFDNIIMYRIESEEEEKVEVCLGDVRSFDDIRYVYT